ncbi:MAG: AMP-binding protein [Candidatus Bipolaricaulis sp.]|nr:AMP-binding protein [Candidatus Bipolaricaulis sp.]
MTLVEAGAWIPPDGRRAVLVRRMPPAKVVYIARRLALCEQLEALRRSRPSILTGCPASLEMIASEMRRLGIGVPRPRVVITRGEVLYPAVRELLAEVFGCRVVDFYNAQEVGNIAWESPDHPYRYHVNRDTCVVEVVDADGLPVPAGEEGRVVVTSLYNTTMPIIRYAIGDRGALEPNDYAACSCGHKGQTLLTLVGRDDDSVVLPGGRAVSPRLIDDLFIDAFRGGIGIEDPFTRALRDYQVVQDSPSHLLVRLEVAEPPPERLRERLVRNLEALHPELCCDVEWAPEIDFGGSGKRKRVVSTVRH